MHRGEIHRGGGGDLYRRFTKIQPSHEYFALIVLVIPRRVGRVDAPARHARKSGRFSTLATRPKQEKREDDGTPSGDTERHSLELINYRVVVNYCLNEPPSGRAARRWQPCVEQPPSPTAPAADLPLFSYNSIFYMYRFCSELSLLPPIGGRVQYGNIVSSYSNTSSSSSILLNDANADPIPS